ncbi:AAC-rich mRNA clone AAC4 protein [Nematostella vectensis]|uniref:AAC-rich mRNA clone AAC4 protein n=1 Tax=Nematostella vectensis TaxID=45351 RepID=UPI0020775B6C|nr:AAC-rich mRNA clone AAC4 protein [Nematostella vectensis]
MGFSITQIRTSSRTDIKTNHVVKRRKHRTQKSREFTFSLKPQIYIGENFVLNLGNLLKFREKLCVYEKSGLIITEIEMLRSMEAMNLSSGAVRMASTKNAGGSSEISEILSCEMMQRCYGAVLDKTELEVLYFPEGGSITDYTCNIFGLKIGVSVTRAMKYRGEFTTEDAAYLLCKKLKGIVTSSRNTMEHWHKQILHVWAASADVAKVTARAYRLVPSELKSNTVVLLTVSHNAMEIF